LEVLEEIVWLEEWSFFSEDRWEEKAWKESL